MSALRMSIIDSSEKRRRAVARALQGCGLQAEPFEDLCSLPVPKRCSGLFMVCDEDDLLGGAIEYLRQSYNSWAIVAYSEAPELVKVVTAMRKGVADYLGWPATGVELRDAIREGLSTILFRSEGNEREMQARLLVSRLTNREREVIKAVAMGMTNREIASQLGASHRTIEIHRANALRKLEANTSPEAVMIANHAGLIN